MAEYKMQVQDLIAKKMPRSVNAEELTSSKQSGPYFLVMGNLRIVD